ncbi:hypothetical protein DYB31_009882 [Paramuricea clavata]|uniref:Uncharacterized protein n=1 Tax=Paramuricea clavata TaxID=317549 RepID=A0A7D9D7A9_PARCT|nr:hypothetical protein DYB31_009882 [Paramuricea clavata]
MGNAKQKEKGVAIKAVIADPDFVTKLNECTTIMTPIDIQIKIFQRDAVPCSDVYKAFVELEEKMRNLPNVEAGKKAYLVELVHKRFDFVYGDAHGVAYLLDPRYMGDAASAASERNFSTFGCIHSKLRNRLGPEKVKKLVYIKTNSLQMSDVLLKDIIVED